MEYFGYVLGETLMAKWIVIPPNIKIDFGVPPISINSYLLYEVLLAIIIIINVIVLRSVYKIVKGTRINKHSREHQGV